MKQIISFGMLLLFSHQAFGICGQILETTQVKIRSSPDSIELKSGEIYKVKGANKERTKLTLWIGPKVAVIERNKVKLMKGAPCEAQTVLQQTKPPPPPPPIAPEAAPSSAAATPVIEPKTAIAAKSFWDIWRPGFEVAWILGTNSDMYDDLITEVPDPTNVGNLQDPIITDVKNGKGYAFRGLVERQVLQNRFRWQVGLGYRQQTFTYIAKRNPTTGAVTLGQLESYEKDIQLNQVELGTGISYKHPIRTLIIGYGVHLDVLYNLSGEEKIDILVVSGPFFKNTPSQVKGGPATLDYQVKAKIDARWKNTMAVLSIAQDASLQLGLGYIF